MSMNESRLCVKTSAMTKLSPFAAPIEFDFSDEASGERCVVAYAVALSYFKLMYKSNSSTKVGQMGVTLCTNQVGNVIHVTANLVFSSYAGAEAEPTGSEGAGSFVRATAIAYVAPPSENSNRFKQAVIGNLYGLNGDSGHIPVSEGSKGFPFIAGFNVALTKRSDFSSFHASCQYQPPGPGSTSAGVTAIASLFTGALTQPGTADVAFVNTLGITSYELMLIQTDANEWTRVEDPEGSVSCPFSIQVPLEPSDKILSAGVVLQGFKVDYSNPDPVEYIEVGVTSDELTIIGDQVSGTLRMSVFNDEGVLGTDEKIKPPPDSSMTAFVLAQIQRGSSAAAGSQVEGKVAP